MTFWVDTDIKQAAERAPPPPWRARPMVWLAGGWAFIGFCLTAILVTI